jgi:hypothetical protein
VGEYCGTDLFPRLYHSKKIELVILLRKQCTPNTSTTINFFLTHKTHTWRATGHQRLTITVNILAEASGEALVLKTFTAGRSISVLTRIRMDVLAAYRDCLASKRCVSSNHRSMSSK